MQPCAQVLLTQDNLGIRSQYLNARNTFTELFAYGTVPIVNENDTVAVEQVRFGDNDTLAAQVPLPQRRRCNQRTSLACLIRTPRVLRIVVQVATLVQADWLFLLTDVPALYTANPSTDPTAQPIFEVHEVAELQVLLHDLTQTTMLLQCVPLQPAWTSSRHQPRLSADTGTHVSSSNRQTSPA